MHKRVQLLSNPRNGSTYMGNVLREYIAPVTKNIRNSLTHPPRFNFSNEPFRYGVHGERTVHLTDEYEFLRFGMDKIKQLDKVVVKNHAVHLMSLEKHNLIDEFKSLNFYTIVLLRKDIFESSLSMTLSTIKGEWLNYKDFTRLEIPVSEFTKHINSMINATERLVKNEYELKFNEIIYFEDLKFCARHDFANTKLCNVSKENLKKIEMPKSKYKSPEKKEVVINYDELYEFALDYIPSIEQDFCKFDGTVMTDIKFNNPPQY